MPGTLKLTRDSIVMELRRSPFDIVLDGKDAGSIEHKQTVEKPVEPGHHTLQVRSGRYATGAHSFDVSDGEVASFRCSGARIWPIYLLSFIVPKLALTLRRE
jgi:hypothetical protein